MIQNPNAQHIFEKIKGIKMEDFETKDVMIQCVIHQLRVDSGSQNLLRSYLDKLLTKQSDENFREVLRKSFDECELSQFVRLVDLLTGEYPEIAQSLELDAELSRYVNSLFRVESGFQLKRFLDFESIFRASRREERSLPSFGEISKVHLDYLESVLDLDNVFVIAKVL